MSADDLELVRSTFQPWAECDLARLRELYSEDVVFHSPTKDLVGRTTTGWGALEDLVADLHREWSSLRFEIDELIEAPAGIVSLHRVIAVGRVSGIEVTNEVAAVFEVRDRRISREWVYTDREEALRAAGARR